MRTELARGLCRAAGAVTGLWLGAEALCAQRSRAGVRRHPVTGDEVIVLLGFRNTSPTANRVNRFRVRAALRSVSPTARSSTLCCCGGPVGSDRSEASILAEYAMQCGWTGPVLLEDTSRNTMQNVENAIALIQHADAIKIVSSPGHTLTARRLFRQLRPDLASRLVRAEDYRFGEAPLDKVLEVIFIPARRWARRHHHPRPLPHTVPPAP